MSTSYTGKTQLHKIMLSHMKNAYKHFAAGCSWFFITGYPDLILNLFTCCSHQFPQRFWRHVLWFFYLQTASSASIHKLNCRHEHLLLFTRMVSLFQPHTSWWPSTSVEVSSRYCRYSLSERFNDNDLHLSEAIRRASWSASLINNEYLVCRVFSL